MKISNNRFLMIIIFFIIISCKGQQYPLNTNYEEVPNNSYLKDTNNELNPYIGTYKANFEGNEITLYVTKELYKFFNLYSKKYYQDVLSIKYIVKNSSGNVLQDTKNMNFQPDQIRFTIFSIETWPNNNLVVFYYGGTNCGVGWGKITLKKLNSNQIAWDYEPNSTSIGENCPVSADKTVYLPETDNLIFTKQ
ncbi:hypothetical protein [uncultured Chryseobacterium sp.]|uniref:DUF6705 family protein n=1 Tax=uncultured Chryseobacterium sp. TaxID=259322 RepID=UPI0025D50E45|nr:hypothetical protein [uncultured Chryseobacterium sp.]